MKIRIKAANTELASVDLFDYVVTLCNDQFMRVMEYTAELRQAAIWEKRGD